MMCGIAPKGQSVQKREPVSPQLLRRDYERPVLLDTLEKVDWANRIEGRAKWRLGDHCPYQP